MRAAITRKLSLVTLLVLAVVIPVASPAQEKCFMWKAQSESATIYLCGSVHLANQDLYPLDPAIENAFAVSDALVVEVHLTPDVQRKATMLMSQKGAYPEGDSIDRHLSGSAQKKFRSFLKTKNIDPITFERIRPWYVSMMLIIMEAQRLGYSQSFGIDKHFVDKATGVKAILELESAEDQINILASGTDKEQELSLMESIDQLPTTEQQIKVMMTAWKEGDVSSMEKVINDNLPKDPRLNALRKRLLDDRNVSMAKGIKKFMKNRKTYFVVVGSAHLVGKEGIIALLHNDNYSVTQVTKGKQ